MNDLGDVYKVVAAMTPLYMALGLGYASVKWWRVFNPDQCATIIRFNGYFIVPFFTFNYTAEVDPYAMNFRFLAGDVVAKTICGVALALWANMGKKGKSSWAITSFSLYSLTNTLSVGEPLFSAVYGGAGADLVVQSSIIQTLIWFPVLLFMLEFRRASCSYDDHDPTHDVRVNQDNNMITVVVDGAAATARMTAPAPAPSNFGTNIKKVASMLGKNPHFYACAVGVIWGLLANRWDFEMPSIVEGSVLILAKAGRGVGMFSLGVFMALQEKIINCGAWLTVYAMVLRFVGGPLATCVSSLALGLRSNTLGIVIMQAALPQAIITFVFAKEYGLHANVLSTAVTCSTIVSLPLMIVYYAVLEICKL